VAAWLADHSRSDGAFLEMSLLLVSELVTNSIRHARISAHDVISLTARMQASSIRLEVWDAGTEGSVEQRSREFGDEIGGFGLELVATLSDAWGVDRDQRGTTVWVELATNPPVE
jgi:serine/threonine-protein kinase RsbW